MAMKFAKPQLMLWNGNRITDHNRSPLGISVERIEKSSRMANGTMRKYVIADKRTFDISWDDVPSRAIYTVDGFWGVEDIEDFYNVTPGSFTLTLNYGQGIPETYLVVISDFSKELKKRGRYDMYSASVTLEEV